MLQMMKLPTGVVDILSIGLKSTIRITENISFRPDKILDEMGVPSMSQELFNNAISNTSPISMNNGEEYTIASNVAKSYFGVI